MAIMTRPDQSCPDNGMWLCMLGVPLQFGRRMQTKIALRTAESEYIALSTDMNEVISFIQLMKEIASMFGLLTCKPVFKCKVWEDNASCITVAKAPTFTPHTKHTAIKYHHFRSFVSDGTIMINPIDTSEQLADMLTKPLTELSFCYLRKVLVGWQNLCVSRFAMEAYYTYHPWGFRGSVRFHENQVFIWIRLKSSLKYIEVGNFRP